MKISLERIDSHAFVVDLPGTHVAIRSAAGLRGELEQSAGRLVLSASASVQLERVCGPGPR